ncbi:MAG: hypothetical protein NTW33_11820 [Methanoregula sp.]|nr:hypothetical protein [Methanoregula sp.]
MHRYIALPRYSITHTDFVRLCVIVSLSLSSIFISSLALAQNIHTITPQLFYFPIIYAAYFYRRRGIYVAGACAIAYQAVAYYYIFPDMFSMGYATGQSVLFICVAAAVSHFTERLTTSEGRYRSIFENSYIGIVFFNLDTLTITLANGKNDGIPALLFPGRAATVFKTVRIVERICWHGDPVCDKERRSILCQPVVGETFREPGELFGCRYQ